MRKYDLEFKRECVKKFMDGQSIAAISRETGVSEGLLHRWKSKIIVKENGEVDREKLALRKRILELEMENDILKKAAAIFSRSP